MNALAIIQKKIQKTRALADSQVLITKYRGVECKTHQTGNAVHGKFTYRGRTYFK